eukprot:1418240-Amphidinium_carterae.1
MAPASPVSSTASTTLPSDSGSDDTPMNQIARLPRSPQEVGFQCDIVKLPRYAFCVLLSAGSIPRDEGQLQQPASGGLMALRVPQ